MDISLLKLKPNLLLNFKKKYKNNKKSNFKNINYNLKDKFIKIIKWLLNNMSLYKITSPTVWLGLTNINNNIININNNIIEFKNNNKKIFTLFDSNFNKNNFINLSSIRAYILSFMLTNNSNKVKYKKYIKILKESTLNYVIKNSTLKNTKLKNNILIGINNYNKKIINITTSDYNKKYNYLFPSKKISTHFMFQNNTIIKNKQLPRVYIYKNNKKMKINIKTKFDIILHFSKKNVFDYYFNNKKNFEHFYNTSIFALNNISNDGNISLKLYNLFDEIIINYICYLSFFFKKIIIIPPIFDKIKYNRLHFYVLLICPIKGFLNKMKKNPFKTNMNFTDKISMENKELIKQMQQYQIYMLNNEYEKIYKMKDLSIEDIYYNMKPIINMYMIENNIRPNILVSDIFRNVSDKILFNLNFLIPHMLNFKLSKIYSLEYIEYLNNFILLFNQQYGHNIVYELYDKKEMTKSKKTIKKNKEQNKETENILLYVEYDEETIKKYTNNVETYLTKFKYIFLPANLANFFYGFYVKEYYEDYYLLQENVHLKNGPSNEK